MKKIFRILSFLCIIIFFLNSCGEIFREDDTDEKNKYDTIVSINRVNWQDYCEIRPYFLGVEDNKFVTSCWIEIDNNYKVYDEIFVEVSVTFDVFYYTNLLGGDETHRSVPFLYSGFVSDNLEELTCRTSYSYEVAKEHFQGEKPEITVHQIFGKICK